MHEGEHEFYVIQHRRVGEGKWLKIGSPIEPVEDKEWSFSGSFGRSFDPFIGTGNNWRAKNRKAHRQYHDLYMATGYHGWYDIKYAIAALKRVREDNAKGEHDYADGYGKKCQEVRHEFRIVKLKISMAVEVVDFDMVCAAL